MAHWLEALIDLIMRLVATLGYAGVFLAHFAEGAWLPITSEVFLLFGGFLVLQGRFDFWGIVGAAASGFALGSLIPFSVSRFGGVPLVMRYGKYIHLSPERFFKVQSWLRRYGDWVVLATRPVPVLRNVVTVPAGLSTMSPAKFLIYTFMGFLPWAIIISYMGYRLGRNWEQITPYLELLATIVVAGGILLVVWLAYRFWQIHRERGGADSA